MSKHQPDDIVQARRCKGFGDVESPTLGPIREGDVVPMRYEEASSRADFEVVDEPEPVEPEQSEPEGAVPVNKRER